MVWLNISLCILIDTILLVIIIQASMVSIIYFLGQRLYINAIEIVL